MEEPLPARLRLPVRPGADLTWIATLAMATVALACAVPEDRVIPLGRAIARHLERGAPQQAAELLGALAASPDIRGLCKGILPLLLRALDDRKVGGPMGALEELLMQAGDSAAARAVRSVAGAWPALSDATESALLNLTSPERRVVAAERALPSGANTRWLTWVHGWSRSTRGGGAADDVADALAPDRQARAHHFATLVQAMAASTAALFDLRELGLRFNKRGHSPGSWGELLWLVLLRQSVGQTSGYEDVRGLPILRMVGTWGRLRGEDGIHDLGEALERLNFELRPHAQDRRPGRVWPNVRFERTARGLVALTGGQRARDRDDLLWIGAVLKRVKGQTLACPLGDLERPQVRTNAALAHTLHESADNFAVRVFPSLALWGAYFLGVPGRSRGLQRWMTDHGDVVLMACRRALPAELTGWKISDPYGRPWTASRLFIEVTRANARQAGGLSADRFRATTTEAQAAIPSLLVEISQFLRVAAQDTVGKRAIHREDGVRWSRADLAWSSADLAFFADLGLIRLQDDESQQVMERLSVDREDADYEASREAPGILPDVRVGAAETCPSCAALRGILEEDPRWVEADRPALETRIAPALDDLHRVFHVQQLAGVCPDCAALLLPVAAAATGAVEESLLEHLATPERQAVTRLVEDLRVAVAAHHAAHHAEARFEPRGPPRRVVFQLQLRAAGAEASAQLDRHLRSASEVFVGDEVDFSRQMIAAALPRIGPATPEALTRLLGATLGGLMLQRNIARLWDAALHHARALGASVRLNLDADGEVGAYPWELSCDPGPQGAYLALEGDVEIVRVSRLSAAVRRVESPQDPRVLLVTAGLPDRIAAHELEVLRRSAAGRTVVEGASQEALLDALRRGPWTVLHLACHGEAGLLRLRDGAPLDAHTLAELVQGRVSDAVILNACWGTAPTRPGLPGGSWSSLAGALLERGLPHVVGALTPLVNADALALAGAWHQAFARHGDPVQATAEARRAVRDRRPHGPAFGLIQHYSVTEGGP